MTQQKEAATRWRLMPLPAALSALALAGTLMAAPVAQADAWVNGGFEDGNYNGWTVKQYDRTVNGSWNGYSGQGSLDTPAPTSSSQLKLTNEKIVILNGDVQPGVTLEASSVEAYKKNLPFIRNGAENSLVDDTQCGNGSSTVGNCQGANSAPNLTLPRWGNNVVRIGGHGGRKASSIEQTVTMGTADIDPTDGKIHVRFALAPIMYDEGHWANQQPYFFVEVINETKGTTLATEYNYVSQDGVPWQYDTTYENYKYTDWKGFDISPGNGLLDVGDKVTLRVYVANCAQGGAGHTSLVYLDAAGSFMPGLAVHATGPTTTQPDATIPYTYHYINNSGVYSENTKVEITAPFTEDGKPLTFDEASIPSNCTPNPPATHIPASRGKYVTCDAGHLSNNQGGSLNMKFKVPSDASTTAPTNVVNNGDYNIYATSVSPYIGPLVKTNIVGTGESLVDLGVTIDNGGKGSFKSGEEQTYTVTVKNHDTAQYPGGGTVTQTITGMGNNCSALTITPAEASCAPNGTDAVDITMSIPASPIDSGDTWQYTVEGTPTSTPVNTVAKVNPTGTDKDTSNNTAGMNTPMAANTPALTVNASGNGAGHVLSTESTLACGNAGTACSITGTTRNIAEGQEVRFTPVPHTGSMFTGWNNCEAPVGQLQGDICVVTMGTNSHTVTANFVQAVVVTPDVEAGGSVDKGPTQVEKGTNVPPLFVITPPTGKVPYIDTTDGGTCKAGTMTGPDGDGKFSYTPGTPVDENCNFKVKFKNPEPNMVPEIKLPGPITVGQPYNKGELTCTNKGTAVADNATCTVTGLPPGLALGQCVITPLGDPFVNQSVPVGGVISCPITGTPTGGPGTPTGTAEWDDPENPTGPKKENKIGANGGTPGNTVLVLLAAPVPVDNPFALLLLALGLLGLGSRYARKRVA